MAEKLKTYFCKDILVSLGSHALTGAADGDFLTIEPGGDGTTKKVGAYGEVVRSISPDQTANVKITLAYKSPTVAFCQEQYNKDQTGTDAVFSLLIKDLRGSIIFSAEEAWVAKNPARSFGQEAPTVEIEIETGEATWESEA